MLYNLMTNFQRNVLCHLPRMLSFRRIWDLSNGILGKKFSYRIINIKRLLKQKIKNLSITKIMTFVYKSHNKKKNY